MVDSGDAEVRARVRRLLGFLRETVAARSKPVRAYGPDTRLEWLYRPGRALEIDSNAAPGQTAVRVPRVSVETAPAPSPTWSAWVNGTVEDARKRPVVDPAIPREHREAAHEWLAEWSRWAEEDSRIRPFAALYLSVDRMREDILEQPETVEVVLASGLLAVDVGGSAIDAHLVTQPVEIMREDETGDLLVRATLGSSARLEDKQIFAGLHGLDISQSDRLLSKLTETASTPLSPEVSDVLSEWAARAVGGLRYVSASDMPPAIRRGTVREAPALLLRPRSGFALISYFDAMIAAMDTGAPVPLGLQQLVESIDSTDRLDWLSRKPGEAPAEVLFPLAVNRAQGSIMEKLALDTGVVVEGPPGTGKTHTIANLMSAMLAQGKRVLVTSEKAQALRVLRDKLPAELQDLCVSVTDLAKGGSAELDHSVSVIADRLEKFELGDADRRISDLTRRRHGAYQRRHVIKQSAVSARRAEAEYHHFGHRYTGTLVGILQKLEGTEHLSWVPGPVYSEAPPITETEFLSLATLLVSSEAHEVDRRQHTLPRLGDVLPPAAAIRRLLEQSSQASVPAHLADVRPTDARQHAAVARRILGKATALDGDSQRMLQETLSGRLSAGWDKASELPQLVERARDLDRRLGSAVISVGDASRRVFEAYDLAAQALAGGRGLRRLRTPRELTAVAELGMEVTVDGNVPRTATDYRAVADHLQFALLLDDARSTLFELGIELPPAHDRRQLLEQVQAVWDRLIDVRAVTSAITSLESALDGRIRLLSIDDVQSLIHDLAAVVTSAENQHVAERLIAHASDFEAATGGADSPEALQVSDALRLADRAAFDDAVVAYEHALGEHHEQSVLDALLSRLDLEAPSLSPQLVEDRTTDWPALAATFNDAWAWRWARQQVEQRLTRPTAPNLDDDFDAADGDLSALTATLAAESAWRACLQRMTTREMQALRTYQDSVGHIGDGRNRRTQRYRAAARTAMHEAQSAVPAWIMPIGEVLSTIPPVQDSFDVVIVDEASQAEPSSLFLMWLAPRVIVVGDDRQCAPNLIPQESEERVLARLDTYLTDLPMHVRNNFGPGSSLFSLLRSRYAQRVRLREHFRSMPEIIEWSSTQFYRDTPLVPVRQFGVDRLKPLRSTFVAGAATRGSGTTLVNEAEAESLVEALCTCVADTDYDGKTIGVVVLQSQAHAEFIRARLAEKIPAEQRDELRLRVGTPSDFQGDERDVVFVSMVVAPTSVTNALTSARWQRSFNVAASRARDQMWLFHSVRVEELSPADLRASLLTYVHALPAVPVPQMPDVSDAHTPHSSFASMTAQRLFMILRDRGYHVNPSVEINDLELDLVVTGVDTRLAVECDDDRDQSVDAVAVRFDREADLRRAGWNFVRLRASDLLANPGTAVAPVIEALDALGILPGEVTIDQERKTGDWHPVTLTAADEDDDGPEEQLLVALAPSVLTDVAPLPPPVVADTRTSRMPATELEPGETRPPRFDGSTVIRVDSRYGSSRRSSATPSVQPRPAAPRPLSTVIPKRVDTPAAAPAVPATSATGIETLSPEIQARLAALPAASMATGRVIAVAAARPGAPLTVRRCALVTGLTPVAATQLLGELQRSGKLVRRQRRDGVAEWVRPEDAA